MEELYKMLFRELSGVAHVVAFREEAAINRFPLIELGVPVKLPNRTKDYTGRATYNMTIHVWQRGTSLTSVLSLLAGVENKINGLNASTNTATIVNSTMLTEDIPNSKQKIFHGAIVFTVVY